VDTDVCTVMKHNCSLQPPAHAGSSLAAGSSTLKMEAIHSSETSVQTRSTRLHIPEDGILRVIIFYKIVDTVQFFENLFIYCLNIDLNYLQF
jgi:hypothetical protein